MLGEMKRSMKHAGDTNVVDVWPVTEGEWLRLIFHSAGSNTALNLWRIDWGVVSDSFDRIKNFDVAGTPTEVSTEMWSH